MIALILAAALTFDYPATVVETIDGDTLKITGAGWPELFDPIDVRVKGIDAPEHQSPQAKSACEVKLGQAAQAYAKSLARPGDPITIHHVHGDRDKFGRVLAGVTLADGSDLAARMLSAGMARAYTSANLHKGPWCKAGKPLPITP